jgi:hypothetical protein
MNKDVAFTVFVGGHFEFCAYRPPGVSLTLCAMVFEIVISIPITMQSFKKLSQSARFL